MTTEIESEIKPKEVGYIVTGRNRIAPVEVVAKYDWQNACRIRDEQGLESIVRESDILPPYYAEKFLIEVDKMRAEKITMKEIAQRFKIDTSTLYRRLKAWRKTSTT